MHVHYPGFAHVVKQGDGYLMLPEFWDQAFGGEPGSAISLSAPWGRRGSG